MRALRHGKRHYSRKCPASPIPGQWRRSLQAAALWKRSPARNSVSSWSIVLVKAIGRLDPWIATTANTLGSKSPGPPCAHDDCSLRHGFCGKGDINFGEISSRRSRLRTSWKTPTTCHSIGTPNFGTPGVILRDKDVLRHGIDAGKVLLRERLIHNRRPNPPSRSCSVNGRPRSMRIPKARNIQELPP